MNLDEITKECEIRGLDLIPLVGYVLYEDRVEKTLDKNRRYAFEFETSNSRRSLILCAYNTSILLGAWGVALYAFLS